MVAGFCVWRRKPNGANGAHPNASAPALREPNGANGANGANGGTPYTFLDALRGGCGFTAFVAELASRLQVKRRRVLPRCLSKESKKSAARTGFVSLSRPGCEWQHRRARHHRIKLAESSRPANGAPPERCGNFRRRGRVARASPRTQF
jgi:hypothetical protein